MFKGHMFFKELVMSSRHMKKEIPGSHYFFLCTEQFTYTNLFTFFAHRPAHSLNMQNVHSLYIFIIAFVSLSVPTYCILMQLNYQLKLFSFINVMFLLSDNGMNMKK